MRSLPTDQLELLEELTCDPREADREWCEGDFDPRLRRVTLRAAQRAGRIVIGPPDSDRPDEGLTFRLTDKGRADELATRETR